MNVNGNNGNVNNNNATNSNAARPDLIYFATVCAGAQTQRVEIKGAVFLLIQRKQPCGSASGNLCALRGNAARLTSFIKECLCIER